jgi:4-carboxymuconolactone decarboxylase
VIVCAFLSARFGDDSRRQKTQLDVTSQKFRIAKHQREYDSSRPSSSIHSNWIYMHAQRISRHDLGMSAIRAIGDDGFNSLSAALDSLDPDFKTLLIEGAYADIIARPNLSLKYRELITVAVLTASGNASSALKYHAGGMLNTGWTPEALLETAALTLAYAGVPVAMAGVRLVGGLLDERGLTVRDDAYRRLMKAMAPGQFKCTATASGALTQKERQLAMLAIVMAAGNQEAAVRRHLQACLRLGWTRSELTEMLIQLTGYIGWPIVLPLTRVALDVFANVDTGTGKPVDEAIEINASISESLESAKARHLTDIACLTCLARHADAEALAAHVREALALGVSRTDVTDAIMRGQPHAGMLAVQSALRIAEPLFASTALADDREPEATELQAS